MKKQAYTITKYGKEWRNAQGQLHRLDGPALEWTNGYMAWYQNDQRHRLDGPAIECANGTTYWYQNDQLHRLDGPAVKWADGTQEWLQYGKLHRLDGPAIEHANGTESWYINDQWLTSAQFLAHTQSNELSTSKIVGSASKLSNINFPAVPDLTPSFSHTYTVTREKQVYTIVVTEEKIECRNAEGQLHCLDGPAIKWTRKDDDFKEAWYQNGKLHRTDGPANTMRNGVKEWYQNGKLHCTDGPAVKSPNGDKLWYQNGQLHRLDGPALEVKEGKKMSYLFFIDGQMLTKQEFLAKTSPKS